MTIYKENILELYKFPHNFGKLSNPTHTKRIFNPLCGDDITIELIIKDDKVEDIKFNGKGCAISMAAGSLLTDKVKGEDIESAKKIPGKEVLEMLNIPIGPVRMRCALLPLEALQGAVR